MPVDFTKARNSVYEHGTMWERALFAFLFQDGSLDHLYQCWLCYKNEDHGFGHRLEHDISYPGSHALALEYLLTVMTHFQIPAGHLLDSTPQWLESQLAEDGSIRQPEGLTAYPLAPWWVDMKGQTEPDSIVGNLASYGMATPELLASTQKWVRAHRTIEDIRANEWLFMAYHAYDYYMNVPDFPDVEQFQQATMDNITSLAQALPDEQLSSIFAFATAPDSPIAVAIPDVVERALDYVETTQQEDGHWLDQHNLRQWFPMTTVGNLYTLKQFGRLTV